jgi:thiamine pyrophosphokinase
MHPLIYIFLNGDFTPPPNFPKDKGSAFVIAVDRGLMHTIDLHWDANVLLGDFDSLGRDFLHKVVGTGKTRVLTFPVEKDQTDYELALELAMSEVDRYGTIITFAAFGGERLDMNFANLFLMAASLPQKDAKRPRLIFQDGIKLIFIMDGKDTLYLSNNEKDSLISLIPLCPVVTGVSLSGDFKYPLFEGTLHFGLTLGLSNEFYGGDGDISIEDGILAVFIQPLPKNELPLTFK